MSSLNHLKCKPVLLACLLPCLLLGTASQAQTVLPSLPVLAPTEAAAPASKVPEPQVLRQVVEDDQIRIEELRVRGQTQRITVQPKIPGMPAYEIVPPSGGKAPAQDPKAGQRVWLNLNF